MTAKNELTSQLERLGLTKNEATVYLDLLGRGLTNVGPVVQSTKLHRQLVYEALARLQDHGLVTEAMRDGRKHFQASKPQRLTRMVEQQLSVAEQLVPRLAELDSIGLDRIEVRVLYGRDGYFENCIAMAENAAENECDMKVMGGAPEAIFYDTLGTELFQRYLRVMNKRKVNIKMISPAWYSKPIKDDFIKFPRHELRIVESGLSSPTFTRLTNEMTAIEIFYPEVMILSISSRVVARAYLENWDRLWAQAKPHRIKG